MTAKKWTTQKIRIVIKAFEHSLIDETVEKIIATVRESGATFVWPVPLPTKIQKITLNRSTFVNKDAREQFEIRRHKRLIDVLEPSPKTMELLQNIHIPAWVGIAIQLV